MDTSRLLARWLVLALGITALLWIVLTGASSGLLQGADGTTPDPATLDTPSLLLGFVSGGAAGALSVGIPAAAKVRAAARNSREKLGGDCQDTGPNASRKILDHGEAGDAIEAGTSKREFKGHVTLMK